MLDKIGRTKALLKEKRSSASIQVDGGIYAETIKDCYQAGATNFVAGSSIFGHKDGIAAGIQALRQALND
jgi:ribulose-phosphate 3-epimerase